MGFLAKKNNRKIAEKAARLLLKMAEKGIRPRCAAVIVAAGSASRMGGIDKIFTILSGKPALLRAVEPFAGSSLVTRSWSLPGRTQFHG